MTNFIQRILCLGTILLVAVACEKGTVDLKDGNIGIDPTTDIDGLNQVLQMEGHYYDGVFPKPTAIQIGGPTVDFVPDSMELDAGETMYIPFSVFDLSFAKVCALNMQVLDATGYWKVPVKNDPGTNNFYVDFSIPRFVRSGPFSIVFNVEICVHDSVRFITSNDTTYIGVSPAMACDDSLSGNQGLVRRKFELGDKKGTARLRYYTGSVGNRVDIKYAGKYIRSTGTLLPAGRYPNMRSDGFVSTNPNQHTVGFREMTFEYDPAKNGKDVEVFVLGNSGNNTDGWKIIMYCPKQ